MRNWSQLKLSDRAWIPETVVHYCFRSWLLKFSDSVWISENNGTLLFLGSDYFSWPSLFKSVYLASLSTPDSVGMKLLIVAVTTNIIVMPLLWTKMVFQMKRGQVPSEVIAKSCGYASWIWNNTTLNTFTFFVIMVDSTILPSCFVMYQILYHILWLTALDC